MMEMLCICALQKKSHWVHVVTEHMTCGQYNGGTESYLIFKIIFNWAEPVATCMLLSTCDV